MSEITQGILRMPPSCWMDSHPVDTMQRHNTYVAAADRLLELERENAALRSALDAQADYQRELRADRDRLDAFCHGWRIVHEVGTVEYPDYWFIWTRDGSQPIGEGETLREAIDAARKEAKP